MNSKQLVHQNPDRDAVTQVRILATSDLHMHLTSYDYYSDSPAPAIGLARTASLIHEARNQAQREGKLVLLFDNGDSLQGTPFGEWAAEAASDAHPLPQAYNTLGYDAVGLGNHDFGFGLDLVNSVASQSICPVVCSNLQTLGPAQGWEAYTILKRTVLLNGWKVPIRIGVLSVLPPQTAQWEAHMLRGQVDVTDILTAAKRTAQVLRKMGCDLVIALAHTGLGSAKAEPEMENAIIPLAEMQEIDAIVAGHTHLTLPGKAHAGYPFVDSEQGLVHGTPVVMPGWAGSHLGVIDLALARNNEDSWHITSSHVAARAVKQSEAAAPECPNIASLFNKGHIATRKRVAKPVGTIPHALHSYFSYCVPDRGLALIAAAQAAAVRPHLVDTDWAKLPVLSAAAPAKFGGRAGNKYYTDIPAGEISVRHIADLSIFPNELRAVLATGAQIRDWLEMSAGVFNQLSSERLVNLADAQRPGFNFDVLHGVTYQIDLSQPARFDAIGRLIDPAHFRIRNLNIDGQPIKSDQRFVVATNNYRANGGGHFAIAKEARVIDLPPLGIQEILCQYVADTAPPDPLENAPRPFTFAPNQGRGAILTTGPGARNYLDELAEYQPRVLPDDSDGFMRIQLAF